MKKILCLLSIIATLVSCNKLDVLPENILKDQDILGNAPGVTAFMAGLYNRLPMEDFGFNASPTANSNNPNGRGYWDFNNILTVNNNTGEGMNKNVGGINYGALGYWDDAYKVIRQANYVLQNMPAQAAAGGISKDQIDKWSGEAHFILAFTYFELAKRYGGVPIVNTVQNYPEQSISDLQVKRNSEQEVWDFIGEECDHAYSMLGPTSEQKGRANKYVAAGLKSRAMLFAGSIAKYNTKNTLGPISRKRIQGIPTTEAVRYFKASYDAAKLVAAGGYVLYRSSGDKVANYSNLFFDTSDGNKEMLLQRFYSLSNYGHSYDVFAVPRQMVSGIGFSSYVCPTLDYVELFDGLPKNADGTLKTTDDNGKYVYYDNRFSFFKNAEPRLLATIAVPGSTLKGQEIDIRRGIYTGNITDGINRFPTPPFGNQANYEAIPGLAASNNIDGSPVITVNGTAVRAGGLSGMYGNRGQGTYSGFTVKKMLPENRTAAEINAGTCTQPWPEMRYAEVLLNRAEAAYELYLLGQAGDYLTDAFTCINDIRDRAGALLLNGPGELNNINVIRKERRKELGFENKIWWDIKRWRTADTEINNKQWAILCPFLVAGNGKYIFDRRTDERGTRFTFSPSAYYENIPGSEISKNPNLDQNN